MDKINMFLLRIKSLALIISSTLRRKKKCLKSHFCSIFLMESIHCFMMTE